MTTKRKPPLIEVRSPPLRLSDGGLDFHSTYGTWRFCVRPIEMAFEVPAKGPYWIAARTRQWPNRTGLPVEVRIECGVAYCRFPRGEQCFLLDATLPKLRELGVPEDGTPMTIYWRLETEVEDD